MAEEQKSNLLEELFRMRDEWRARRAKAMIVVKGKELELEVNQQGKMKWYLHPSQQDRAIQSLVVFMQEIPLGSCTGRQRHPGGTVHYILEGRGYVILNRARHDWEKGDLILLPIEPGGIEHQHFNKQEGKPCRWLALIYAPFLDALGSELEQRENAAQ